MLSADELMRAPIRERGNYLEDFVVGRVFHHHWGRTFTKQDGIVFATSLLQFNAIYFDDEAARRAGHSMSPIPPMLVFATVFGLSVEDLSERGGAFLGVDDLLFGPPVYPGQTLTARSTVMARRTSGSRPNYGVATWLTEGFVQDGTEAVRFVRTNMVVRHSSGEAL